MLQTKLVIMRYGNGLSPLMQERNDLPRLHSAGKKGAASCPHNFWTR